MFDLAWNRWFLAVLLLTSISLWGQEQRPGKDVAIERVMRYLSENDEDNIDWDDLSSKLSYLYDHPIDLNTCTQEHLSSISWFTPIIMMNLLEYQKENNGFVSIYELKLIEGFSDELIMLSVPFLSVTQKQAYQPKISFKNLKKIGNHSLITRYQRVLQKQSGYLPDKKDNTKYLGSPDRLYARYQFDFARQIKAGFTLDKDAGEPFFKSPNQQGFDFMSGFVQLKNKGVIKSLVLGDYALQFGQGLVLWNGFGMRKSSMVTSVSKFGKGVDKYSSTDENRFFRGVASTLQYKDAKFSVFYSSKKIDGRIERDTLNNEFDRLTSFDRTGLHATLSSFEKKHQVGEQVYGANYTHRFRHLKVGGTWVAYQYSVPLQPSDVLYQKHHFSGRKNYNASLFYQWNLNHVFLAGELATDAHQHVAVTNHAVFNVSSKLSLVLLHRYFDKAYHSAFASTFSESSGVQNENGFYAGLQFLPTRNWVLKAYVDYYHFPWLKYQISRPSYGIDYMVVGEYHLSSNFNFYFKYKNESRPKDIQNSEAFVKQQKDENKQQLRLHFDYGDKGQFRFKTRLEWSWYAHDKREKGFLAYQDVIYEWRKIPLRSAFRFLVFDTEGYNSRIYTFENELLYNFFIPAFFERGIRSYLLLKYELLENLDIWLKYGLTVYSDKQMIGSGYNQIEGNTKSEIKLQLRYQF